MFQLRTWVFKPEMVTFFAELKSKDRRSPKEWEYINSAGIWLKLGLYALEMALSDEGTVDYWKEDEIETDGVDSINEGVFR